MDKIDKTGLWRIISVFLYHWFLKGRRIKMIGQREMNVVGP
jgi:hypothetical protein